MESGRTRSSSSSSRKNKGPKKTPQRGLGVEQLERLRTQESLKKMAEASGTIHHHHQQQQQQQFLQSHFVNATGNFNFPRYGALSSNGSFQFPQQQQQQQMMMINENNDVVGSAFSPFIGNNKSGFVGNSSGWFVPNNQHNNNNLVAVGNYGGSGSFLVKNPLEPSKELSSMPNFNSQGFDLCLKKTRLNEENVMRGRNVRRDTFDDFVGFLPQSSVQNFIGENGDFYNKLFKHDESVEVVAVHRRENSSNGNGKGKVFMEYDFFSGKDGRGNMKFGTSTTNYGFGEASITFTAYGDRDTTTSASASNSLDLSLKL